MLNYNYISIYKRHIASWLVSANYRHIYLDFYMVHCWNDSPLNHIACEYGIVIYDHVNIMKIKMLKSVIV